MIVATQLVRSHTLASLSPSGVVVGAREVFVVLLVQLMSLACRGGCNEETTKEGERVRLVPAVLSILVFTRPRYKSTWEDAEFSKEFSVVDFLLGGVLELVQFLFRKATGTTPTEEL